MGKLQKEFGKFHDIIKLGTFEENSALREKRDLLVNELTKSLGDEVIPGTETKLTFTKFDQGSYAMNTGIIPKDNDYDIDVGIIFDVTNGEYDSKKLKKLVYTALNKVLKRTVTYNRPCITVEYSAGYHVDLAIYAKNDNDIHIAWGKESSSDHTWYKSEPKELKKWVGEVSADAKKSEQFRRCVKALKKWKEKVFTSNGNAAPPSIGITIQARNAFQYNEDNDLEALIAIVRTMKNSFVSKIEFFDGELRTLQDIEVNLPVQPYKDVYYKMSPKQKNNFHKRLCSLLEALETARDEDSDHEASKTLCKIFGADFPLIADSKATTTAPYIPTGQNA
jgi:hypothetical protein